MTSTSSDPFSWQEPRNSVVRGAFIVVEGVDRAGKTTQVERLCSKLYALGHNLKTIRFPGNLIFSIVLPVILRFPANIHVQIEHQPLDRWFQVTCRMAWTWTTMLFTFYSLQIDGRKRKCSAPLWLHVLIMSQKMDWRNSFQRLYNYMWPILLLRHGI